MRRYEEDEVGNYYHHRSRYDLDEVPCLSVRLFV